MALKNDQQHPADCYAFVTMKEQTDADRALMYNFKKIQIKFKENLVIEIQLLMAKCGM
jgi:hypothetical protein